MFFKLLWFSLQQQKSSQFKALKRNTTCCDGLPRFHWSLAMTQQQVLSVITDSVSEKSKQKRQKMLRAMFAPTKNMRFGYNLLNLRFLAKTVFRRFKRGRFLQVKRKRYFQIKTPHFIAFQARKEFYGFS
jgi:hypothetical protein